MDDSSEPRNLSFPLQARRQNTICRDVHFRGLSLFHGYESCVRLLPAPEGTGFVFRRTDLESPVEIPATTEYLKKVPRRTALAVGETVVETTEHLLAALSGLQVDNCLIEINCPELPAYDGSCRSFCDGILEAGIEAQTAAACVIPVDRIVAAQQDGGRQSMVVRPYIHACRAVTYHFDYGARAAIPPQQQSVEISPNAFYHHISAARTFVLETEIAALRKMGYGQHLTGRELVVIGKDGPIENRLRWPDEGVRHKILDCVGDLALCGAEFHGHVTATRTGHHLNHEMARNLTMIRNGVANPLSQAT